MAERVTKMKRDGDGAEFALGDVVRLKSGGPAMTVNQLYKTDDDAQAAACVWFTSQAAVIAGIWGDCMQLGFLLDALMHPYAKSENQPVEPNSAG